MPTTTYWCSSSEMSKILGVRQHTLKSYRESGCPCVLGKDHWSWEYNAPEVIAWYLEWKSGGSSKKKNQDTRLDAARVRRQEALAERAEIENDVKRGELLEADTVRQVWTQHVLNVRTRLMTLPDALAPRLARMKSAQLIKDHLRQGLEDALLELSENEYSEDDDGPEEP